ncbi:MAG TPA: GNAT family N-acetyltransferase [Tepidiformaceae bacterium]
MGQPDDDGIAVAAPLITAEPLESLAPEWASLHARSEEQLPYLHPSWQATWLRHFGKGTEPVFLAVRLDEELIGVAALDMDPSGARQLGDPEVCDYAGILAAPGQEGAVASGVLEWVTEDLGSRLTLWGVPEDSPMRTAFAPAAAAFGWSYTEEEEAIAPRAALPGDFEAYLAGLRKHERHEVRRKLRHLEAAGQVAFESYTDRASVEANFDRFLEMMRASRQDKAEFLTGEMEGFFRDLAASLSDAGLLRLSSLSLDGKSTAMIFCFESESSVFLYNSGYDPAFGHLAVGLLSKVLAIRDAIGRGKRVFDFLRGEEEYKRHLGGEPRRVLRLVMEQS